MDNTEVGFVGAITHLQLTQALLSGQLAQAFWLEQSLIPVQKRCCFLTNKGLFVLEEGLQELARIYGEYYSKVNSGKFVKITIFKKELSQLCEDVQYYLLKDLQNKADTLVAVGYLFRDDKYRKKLASYCPVVNYRVVSSREFLHCLDPLLIANPLVETCDNSKQVLFKVRIKQRSVAVSPHAYKRFIENYQKFFSPKSDRGQRDYLSKFLKVFKKAQSAKRENSLQQKLKHSFVEAEYLVRNGWIFIIEANGFMRTCYYKEDWQTLYQVRAKL